MTFDELKTEIKDRLNLSSADADARIGRAINRKYRIITSALGLEPSRRATVQATVTLGASTLTFSNAEKVINVTDRSTGKNRLLKEVTVDELYQQPSTTSL